MDRARWILPSAAFLCLSIAGCRTMDILPVPEGWPATLEGRRLYVTPSGFIYSTNRASAEWADQYLRKRLPQIARDFRVTALRGAVIVVRPEDPALSRVGWPGLDSASEGLTLLSMPPIAPRELSLQAAPWVSLLCTDGFYEEVVRRYHSRVLAKRPQSVGESMFVLLFPKQRRLYLKESDVFREQSLALAIAGSTQNEQRPNVEEVVKNYRMKLTEVENRFGYQE